MLVTSHFGHNRHLHPDGVDDLEIPSAPVGRLHTQSIQQWFQQLKSYKIHAPFQSRTWSIFEVEVQVASYHHSPELRKLTTIMISDVQSQLLTISSKKILVSKTSQLSTPKHTMHRNMAKPNKKMWNIWHYGFMSFSKQLVMPILFIENHGQIINHLHVYEASVISHHNMPKYKYACTSILVSLFQFNIQLLI